MKETILVVEDEKDIRDLLLLNLENEGYSTLEAGDGQKALEIIRQKKVDLILLDIMLPILDGFTVCKKLEAEHNPIPIIILTARGEDIDKILGFELGADDYVVKPFNLRELLLRIKALLRRQQNVNAALKIQLGDLTLDPEAHLALVQNTSLEITATEFRLLEDLMRNKGHVRTREQLLNTVWGYEFEGYARTVDTHIRRLRSKLLHCADYIETVRGIGYKFNV